MTSVPAIALSGLQAAQAGLGVAAHNIANLGTEGFRRQTLRAGTVESGGVMVQVEPAALRGNAPERDLVDQLRAKNAFFANLAVFRTADAMAGSLLSIRA